MARRYSADVRQDQPCPEPGAEPIPLLWLMSDVRNDAQIEHALAALPRRSGFIFRHYHLDPAARRTRFEELRRIAAKYGHITILSGNVLTALKWGADGVYGPPATLPSGGELLALATAHNARDIVAADRAGATAILLSPVFPTQSHPGATTLGPVRFRMLANRAKAPVIALGGMNRQTAKRLGWPRWAAIDGLT